LSDSNKAISLALLVTGVVLTRSPLLRFTASCSGIICTTVFSRIKSRTSTYNPPKPLPSHHLNNSLNRANIWHTSSKIQRDLDCDTLGRAGIYSRKYGCGRIIKQAGSLSLLATMGMPVQQNRQANC
jgi:hypothetical protein